jgi:putative membrane protein
MNRFGAGIAVMGLAGCLTAIPGVGAFGQDTKSSDKSFIKDASEGSLAEVNYAKLALQKSQDPNVRKFAQKMITDHEKLIADMKPFAVKYNVKPSGAPMTDHVKYQELKMKSGTDFDRAYVEAMVKDHHDDLQKFMDEESKTSDPDLKATVQKGEKVVREHTEMIDNIAHMGGIQTPPMPGQ